MRCISTENMGRRKGWFSAVKKALGSEHKEHGNQKSRKPKKKWFAKDQHPDPMFVSGEDDSGANGSLTIKEPDMSTTWTAPWCILEEPFTPPVIEQMKTSGENSKDRYGALATEIAAKDDSLVFIKPAAEVVKVTTLARLAGKSEEEAAIKIQTAFRGRRAKRALRALRGLVRLKSLVQGSSIKRQTASTLQCMQTLSHVQSQIRARRIRMSEENQAFQRQLQQKHEKEMEKMKLTIEDWNGSTKSKEKLEERLRYRQDAAMRRERALAYAHSTQRKLKNASKSPDPILMDEINPYWGWSWLERWMAARPWETSIASDNCGKTSSVLSVAEISKAYFAHRERYPNDSNKPLPIPQRTGRVSTLTTSNSKKPSSPSKATKLKKSTSAKDLKKLKSVTVVRVEKQKRHNVANATATKEKKSLPSGRSSTAPTVAPKARSRLQKSSSSAEKSSAAATGRTVKKRLSSSPSPTPTSSEARRHSGPPTVGSSSNKGANLKSS